jgi:hypothetical protein
MVEALDSDEFEHVLRQAWGTGACWAWGRDSDAISAKQI